jgi:hypothetical protein
VGGLSRPLLPAVARAMLGSVERQAARVHLEDLAHVARLDAEAGAHARVTSDNGVIRAGDGEHGAATGGAERTAVSWLGRARREQRWMLARSARCRVARTRH